MRIGDVPFSAGAEREERFHPGRGVDDPVFHHRRGDDAVGAVVLRVQTAGAPPLPAGIEIVPGHDIAAGDHELEAPPYVVHEGSRIGIGRFPDRLRGPLHPPDGFARSGVNPKNVGRIVGLHSVEHLHVDAVLEQERAARVAPVEAEVAVVRRDVAGPEFGSVEVEGLEDPGAGEDEDVLPVGDRRGRGHVLLPPAHVPVAQVTDPADRTVVPIERPELDMPRVGDVSAARDGPSAAPPAVTLRRVRRNAGGVGGDGDVQKDGVPGNDRGRPAPGGQLDLPHDTVFGVPFDRESDLVADSVVRRATPVRPVLAVNDPRRQQPDSQQADSQQDRQKVRKRAAHGGTSEGPEYCRRRRRGAPRPQAATGRSRRAGRSPESPARRHSPPERPSRSGPRYSARGVRSHARRAPRRFRLLPK